MNFCFSPLLPHRALHAARGASQHAGDPVV
jgi:hypothetical protein